MTGTDQTPITAASLAAREEWRRRFPSAEVVWEETADEGVGIGFDGLDPSAMMRAFLRTTDTWPAVLDWYRTLLEKHHWRGAEFRDDWWEWDAPARPGERFLVMDRSRVPEFLQAWSQPTDSLLFEVLFRARTPAAAEAAADA